MGYTTEDRKARQWLLGRMREAGLDAAIDGIGNVIGRTRGRSGPCSSARTPIRSHDSGRL